MKKSFALSALALVAVVGTTSAPTPARAVGCISGAAVGGIAGHYAGRHGFLGAAAGCAVGLHEKHAERRERDEQDRDRRHGDYEGGAARNYQGDSPYAR